MLKQDQDIDSMNIESMDIKEILKVLPHRYPFLLVDRIVKINLKENYIIGQKNTTINESYFQGHFPGAPIMPGVLILEALAQTGSVLTHLKSKEKKIAVLLHIENAKFRTAVHPGDILDLYCECLYQGTKGGSFKAEAFVGKKKAVEAKMKFAFVDKENL